MSDLIATVKLTCMVKCPECGEIFDALLTDCNYEFDIGNEILDNITSNAMTIFDVICPYCSTELIVDGVEWV